jgi:hypothetical protein
MSQLLKFGAKCEYFPVFLSLIHYARNVRYRRTLLRIMSTLLRVEHVSFNSFTWMQGYICLNSHGQVSLHAYLNPYH